MFRDKSSGEYTVSFRSLEYAEESKGGDWMRDGRPGGAGEISGRGLAFAQAASMERYLENLQQGRRYDAVSGKWIADAKLAEASQALTSGGGANITGFSLGGHLASVFTLLHGDLVKHAYVFNASGLGMLDGLNPTHPGYVDLLRRDLAIYRAVVFSSDEDRNRMVQTGDVMPGVTLTGEQRAGLSQAILDNLVRPPEPGRTYTDAIHVWLLELLASAAVGAGAGRFKPLFDGLVAPGLAIDQLRDKVDNYLASRNQFGDPDPDAFDTRLYEFQNDKITSLYGKGVFFDPELVANTGYHPEAQAIYVEDQPLFRGQAGLWGLAGDFGETHSIALLIDSLTVLDLLQVLDPELTVDTYRAIESAIANSKETVSYKAVAAGIDSQPMILALRVALAGVTGILDATSNFDKLNDADALENTVRAVADLLKVDLSGFDLAPRLIGGGFGDLAKRNQLHDAIGAIRNSGEFAAITGRAPIVQLTGVSAQDILIRAQEPGASGLAYRFALDRLNPFVVLADAAVYERHNPAGELDRWDARFARGRMTDEYLEDRATFLHWKAKLDSYNKVAVQYSDSTDVSYKDLGTGAALDLIATGRGPSVEHQFVWFSDPRGGQVLGGLSDDHLYGSVGSDQIDAARGDDYIEGGDGVDQLLGGAGRDLILGGFGDDEIGGGADADVLEGGHGIDTYAINTGDGADTIHDTGKNFIRWNGQVLAGLFEKGVDGIYRFLSSDPNLRNLTLTFNSPATISDGAGTSLTLEDYDSPDDFATEDFGFALVDESRPRATNRQLLGSAGGDYLEGSDSYNDEILAGAGDDYAVGYDGDDYLSGGEDSDYLVGGYLSFALYGSGRGRDTILGGAGSDILVGGSESDHLFGGELISLGAAIGGAPGASADERGDWLNGSEGDDVLVGSPAHDVLLGAGGADLLVGGAGNDRLFGDVDNFVPEDRDWDFDVQANLRYDANYEYNFYSALAGHANPATSAGDLLYGGAGNDLILAGRGDDDLFGGDGGDLLIGGAGEDVLLGGDGADVLWGGASRVDYTELSDDYLDGGDGDDVLFGSGGQNFLFGGAGSDTIYTGPGEDFVDAGSGNDLISSLGGDTVFAGDGDDGFATFGTDAVVAHGGAGRDRLGGGQAADRLYGGDDDDVLRGFEGADHLDGGTGNDRYRFAVGDGSDELVDEGGTDVIELLSFEGAGADSKVISRANIKLVADYSEIYLAYGDQDERIRLGADPRGLIEWIELRHTIGSVQTVETIDFADLWAAYVGTTQPPNAPPVLSGALADSVVSEDLPFVIAVPSDAFVDPDGDPLEFRASLQGGEVLPAWLTFDAGSGVFSGTPSNEDVGTIEVVLTAVDPDGATAHGAFLLSVTNSNDSPLITGTVATQSAEEESQFELTLPAGLFIDVDSGDVLSLSASLANGDPLPQWLTFDSNTGHISGMPTRAGVGDWAIRLAATDEAGAQASLIFELTVTKAPGQAIGGTSGSDTLIGGIGDDVLSAGPGADALIGGNGDDTFVLAPDDGSWSAWYAAYNAGSPGNPGAGRIVSISGRTRMFDTMDGGEGTDTVQGTAGADAIFLDDLLSPFPGAAGPRLIGVERFAMGPGNDVVDLTSFDFRYDAVHLEGADGDDLLWASAGADALFGGSGSDDLYGGVGDDALFGGLGDDLVDAATGADIAQGEGGHDTIEHSGGAALLDGGAGNDTVIGGAGAEMVAGGTGDDVLKAGAGTNVVLHNRGDGIDLLFPAVGARNSLSLGGGIQYEDLALSRSGNDLLLQTGLTDQVTLVDWYAVVSNQSLTTIQVIAAAMSGFDTNATDPIRDDAVERFDFAELVQAFDAARAADSNLARWQMIDAFVQADLGGSDDLALGGALAYHYGITGGFTGVDAGAAQSILRANGFGADVQPVAALLEGPVGSTKLS